MKIIHLSDLHLRHYLPGTSTSPERLSRSMPQLLEQAVEQIVNLQPDLFVLSGDLIDYPLDQLDSPECQQQALADYQLIVDLLKPIDAPTALVYGNHDHPGLYRQAFAESIQDEPTSSLTICGHSVWTYLDEEGDQHIPHRMGLEQRRFEQALTSQMTMPQIHIQHYVVWPELNEEYPHTYGAGAEMRHKIGSSNRVRLVLSGHYHTGVAPFYDRDVWFATVPAFCEAPHPFWVYELDGTGLTWSQQTVDSANVHG